MLWLAHEVSSPIYGRETSINHSVALAVLCGVHAEVVLEALQRDAAQLLGSMSRVGRWEMTGIDVDDNF